MTPPAWRIAMTSIERQSAPKRIGRRDPAFLTLEWQDGVVSTIPASAIRKACPCAHCVDERTGRPILDPATVMDDLEQREVHLVGHYALGITFADGHRTGIFSWTLLRSVANRVSEGA